MWQDIKFAVRMLVKAPGFTAVAVLSLTLGIGANTTIFTLAKAIFLQAIPVKDPSTLMVLYSTAQSHNGPLQEYLPTPYPNAVDYRAKTDRSLVRASWSGQAETWMCPGKKWGCSSCWSTRISSTSWTYIRSWAVGSRRKRTPRRGRLPC